MVSVEKIAVRNLETGETGIIRKTLFDNPAFNDGILVEVDEDAKPYVPELYKSRLKEPAQDSANEDVKVEKADEKAVVRLEEEDD